MDSRNSELLVYIAVFLILIISSVVGMSNIAIGLLFWGAIIWVIFSIINDYSKKSELKMLKKRYDNDEITREQYLKRERELKGKTPDYMETGWP